MKTPKVVILCGGLGTRLRSVNPYEDTEYRPKPLVEIGGRPILWHIMKMYAHYGFKEFVVCLGFRGNMIKEYFLNYRLMNDDLTLELGRTNNVKIESSRCEEDWVITLAHTGDRSMTGSRIKQIEKYIDEDYFMVTYGDGVANLDIPRLVQFHLSHGGIGTVTGVFPSSRFGELIVGRNNPEESGAKVLKFSEKPEIGSQIASLPVPASGQMRSSDGGFINGGFFVFNRTFFKYLNDSEDCILEREPLERLTADGELWVYKHKGFWQCMDTYRELTLLNQLWDTPRPPWKVWADGSGQVREQ